MASSSYKPDKDVIDIETGETKSLINNNTNNINSTYSNYDDIDLSTNVEVPAKHHSADPTLQPNTK